MKTIRKYNSGQTMKLRKELKYYKERNEHLSKELNKWMGKALDLYPYYKLVYFAKEGFETRILETSDPAFEAKQQKLIDEGFLSPCLSLYDINTGKLESVQLFTKNPSKDQEKKEGKK